MSSLLSRASTLVRGVVRSLEAILGLGFVVGSLFMARYADRLQTGLWVFVGLFGMGVSGVLYSMSQTVWIAILWVVAAVGAGVAAASTVWATVWGAEFRPCTRYAVPAPRATHEAASMPIALLLISI